MRTALLLALIIGACLALIAVAALGMTIARVLPVWLRRRRAGHLSPTLGRLLQIGWWGSPAGLPYETAVEVEATGLAVDRRALAGHGLAGGNPHRVVQALALAHERGDDVKLERLLALDLMGYDPVEAVRAGDYHPDMPAEVRDRLGGAP